MFRQVRKTTKILVLSWLIWKYDKQKFIAWEDLVDDEDSDNWS